MASENESSVRVNAETRLRRGFGSDNQSGVHPAVIEAIAAANGGHVHAYGDDPWTARATAVIRRLLGDDIEVVFTFNGTGANCVALGVLARPWESVICAETAHINVDECAAPERIAGVKLVAVATPDGKLAPGLVEPHLTGFGFEHHAQPRVISISQASEYGTVYTCDEIRALADLAHARGMLLHVDGARLANAAASLGCTLREMIAETGVDALSLGGTKNGMMYGEAVVILDGAPSGALRFVRKQTGQLASKMRFMAAQFEAVYGTGLWLETAAHANAMARSLAEGARAAGVRVTQAVEANEVFALLERDRATSLAEEFGFYVWDERASTTHAEVRWVTSWDTTAGDVDALVTALASPHGTQ